MGQNASDLTNCPVPHLLAAARQHNVRFHLWANATTQPGKAGRLDIWSSRDPCVQPLVEAMRARREEIAFYLRKSRPPVRIAEAEERYRREVLCEPDVSAADLHWPTLAAMVIAVAVEAVDAHLANLAWERSTRGRDDEPPPSRPSPAPPPPALTGHRAGYEYRGGRIVRR
jgi:hypothetical protein